MYTCIIYCNTPLYRSHPYYCYIIYIYIYLSEKLYYMYKFIGVCVCFPSPFSAIFSSSFFSTPFERGFRPHYNTPIYIYYNIIIIYTFRELIRCRGRRHRRCVVDRVLKRRFSIRVISVFFFISPPPPTRTCFVLRALSAPRRVYCTGITTSIRAHK